ncbi:MAG: DUF1835 domain-containing protein [Chitinophagales bacterium]|nr:DUF1835 domain-containing protein [Chitinophagaceae bacterium]MCB9065775.1 DUF1835 domain-containing protein [Chitinophagales bacterium]
MAAPPLLEAISNEPEMAGEVVILRDILHVGPLKRAEGQSFSDMRTEFWQQVVTEDKNEVKVDDLERLLQVVTQLNNNEDDVVWLWMAPWPADVCAYYWALQYLAKHLDRYYVLNLGGLPFLDEEGKVYYPQNMSEILPKELVKARRLARPVTPAELEVDGEEWSNIVEENSGLRLLEGGKKLYTKERSFFDDQLLSFCSHQFQKAHRIVNQAMKKMNIPTGDLFLGWRLRKLAEQEMLLLEGDANKTLRDFNVKLPGGAPVPEGQDTPMEDESGENEETA